jgi:O-acetyl-ADP-ribose deacetylase (regulator of RNase III)
VIHTVGPIYKGGDKGEDELLARAYTNSLRLALDKGLKIISFPSISTGAYGFPIERASKIAIRSVIDFVKLNEGLEEVRFVLFSDKDFKVYVEAIKQFL